MSNIPKSIKIIVTFKMEFLFKDFFIHSFKNNLLSYEDGLKLRLVCKRFADFFTRQEIQSLAFPGFPQERHLEQENWTLIYLLQWSEGKSGRHKIFPCSSFQFHPLQDYISKSLWERSDEPRWGWNYSLTETEWKQFATEHTDLIYRMRFENSEHLVILFLFIWHYVSNNIYLQCIDDSREWTYYKFCKPHMHGSIYSFLTFFIDNVNQLKRKHFLDQWYDLLDEANNETLTPDDLCIKNLKKLYTILFEKTLNNPRFSFIT